MGFYFRRTRRVGRHTRVSVSRRGLSASWGIGPLRINSRGRVSLRLGHGFGWRS